jgi:hypothetical protein
MWGTIVAVALGAVFGVGSTMLTDLLRARRDLRLQWADTRRAVYVRFAFSLSRAHSRILKAAFENSGDGTREKAVHDAYHDDPEHVSPKAAMRELAIVAPDHVYDAARRVYDCLQALRNQFAEDAALTRGSAEYKKLNHEYREHLRALELIMRDDLKPALHSRHHSVVSGAHANTPNPALTD